VKNKISRIDVVAFQSKIRRITIWRRQTNGIDYPTNYIAATRSNSVTESSMIRAQRAQRILAGMRVDEWPFKSSGIARCDVMDMIIIEEIIAYVYFWYSRIVVENGGAKLMWIDEDARLIFRELKEYVLHERHSQILDR